MRRIYLELGTSENGRRIWMVGGETRGRGWERGCGSGGCSGRVGSGARAGGVWPPDPSDKAVGSASI